MVRALRIEYPGAYYPVMNCTLRGEAAFGSEPDFKGFLTLIEDTCYPEMSGPFWSSIRKRGARRFQEVRSSSLGSETVTTHRVKHVGYEAKILKRLGYLMS